MPKKPTFQSVAELMEFFKEAGRKGGKIGGKIGGKRRAENLSAKELSAIGKLGAAASAIARRKRAKAKKTGKARA